MDDRIGFLISDVSRLLRRRFDQRARQVGVTLPQLRVLTALIRREGLNQGSLAEFLEAEPVTLCRIIDRLEEAGLVERRRDPADRRAWLIFLTDKSRPVIERIGGIADSLLEIALADIAAADQERLVATLDTIRANLAAPGENVEKRNG